MIDYLQLNKYTMTDLAVVPKEAPCASYFSELIGTAFGGRNKKEDESSGTAVLFTGLDRGCGVSYVCSSVAAELGARGGKVLLADATALEVVGGMQRAVTFCERVEDSNVWVLGMRQVRPDGLRASAGAGVTVLESLRKEFSYVVVDAPSLTESDMALTLASVVHGVVLVVQSGRTETNRLRQAQTRFTSLGAKVLGSVFNAK